MATYLLSQQLRSRRDHVIVQHAVIAGLIQFALHLVLIPEFAIGKLPLYHKRPSTMFYDWYETRVGSLSPTLRCTWTLLYDPNILNFDSTALLPRLSESSPTGAFLTLLCFLNCGFLTAILPYNPASLSLHFASDVITFFHDIGSVMQWCFQQWAICYASWWLWWNCPLYK